MQSAPAVLRLPSPDMDDEADYPWAINTPEMSPRQWGVEPQQLNAYELPPPPLPYQAIVPNDVSQSVCAPIYEQMCWHVSSNSDVLASVSSVVSQELIRVMCEPYFDQMATALQQALQKPATQETQIMNMNMKQNMGNPYFESVSYTASKVGRWDEESTDADEACAFASLLSGPSSEAEDFEVLGRKAHVSNEDSETTSEAEKSIMVCRHWKSKGWCRMETRCKFLHPEHKRGITVPNDSASITKVDRADVESTTPTLPAGRHKKRGGKNKSNKAQLSSLEQAVPAFEEFQGYAREHYNECFPCMSMA